MSYTKLFDIIRDNDKLKSFITNMSSGYVGLPYIMEETLKMLEDDSIFANIISDNNKRALAVMLDMYFDSCYERFIEDVSLDKLLSYGRLEVYKIDAANGLRYATVNEVAQGVQGLIPEYIYPAGEDAYKKLCLLQWTYTGVIYFFRMAGYNLNYDKDGKVLNNVYDMIQMSANDLKDMFSWMADTEAVNKAIKKIDKMKRNKGYKYASFEKDEIVEDITIKQLVHNIDKIFPRNSTNPEYRKAISLVIKTNKYNQRLTPLEIAELRAIYHKHALDTSNRNNDGVTEESSRKLKEECERLLKERFSGKINSKHFAYTIIDSLRKSNYSKCSAKQYSYILEALQILDKYSNDSETFRADVISEQEIDNSLASLSDAIGKGLFEDEEGED